MDKINELITRRQQIELGGGEAAVGKVHADGKMSARERIEQLLDSSSFVEVGAFIKHRSTDFNMAEKEAPADGVITGYGTVEGRLVYVFSQDPSVLGGSVGEMHGKKISNIYDLAMKMGAPVIGLYDSAGLRLQEATDGLEGYGLLYLKQSVASGVIPQIGVVLGDCAGGASFVTGISDFTFMGGKNAKIFVNSPNAMEGKDVTFDSIATAAVHEEKSGIADFAYESEEECLQQVRVLLGFLPSNNMEDAPLYDNGDDLNRVSEELNEIIPEDAFEEFDVKAVIGAVADQNQFLEVKSGYGKSLVTGFIRLNGATVGIVANQTLENQGYLDARSVKKGAEFVYFCDAFNISVVSFTDVPGFLASVCEEIHGIAKESGRFAYAWANATVPKVNIIIRKAYGSAYVNMNSKHIGADLVFAWPSAQISVMNSDSAVRIMYSEEIANSQDASTVIDEKISEFESMQSSPYAAASRGYVDDVIEPAATRKRVIAALEMLLSKRENRPAKKHGSVL